MMLVAMLELVLWMSILWCFYTQVFIPVYKGTKLFPIFRRETDLRAALAGEKQATVESEIEKQIELEKKSRRTK